LNLILYAFDADSLWGRVRGIISVPNP
jgi:hypothetical protein